MRFSSRLAIVPLCLTVVVAGCRACPFTLEDWSYTPIRATLQPLGNLAVTQKLVIRVRNQSRLPIFVKRVGLQVGHLSTGATTAFQSTRDAEIVNWLIWPSGERVATLDLRSIKFHSVTDSREDAATRFVQEIDPGDRQFLADVLHYSAHWRSGCDEAVRWPDGA